MKMDMGMKIKVEMGIKMGNTEIKCPQNSRFSQAYKTFPFIQGFGTANKMIAQKYRQWK